MSLYEAVMLLCFGAAWPVSIYKSYTSRNNGGKSVIFLFIILIGYIAGIIHKIKFSHDIITYLYFLNGLMVSVDILLFFRNVKSGPENKKVINNSRPL